MLSAFEMPLTSSCFCVMNVVRDISTIRVSETILTFVVLVVGNSSSALTSARLEVNLAAIGAPKIVACCADCTSGSVRAPTGLPC